MLDDLRSGLPNEKVLLIRSLDEAEYFIQAIHAAASIPAERLAAFASEHDGIDVLYRMKLSAIGRRP